MNIFSVSGDLLRLSASVILLLDLRTTKSGAGLSRKSLELTLLACFLKYLDLLLFFTSLYNSVMKLAFIFAAAYPVHLLRSVKAYKTTYEAVLDTFPLWVVLVPCAGLALLFNHSLSIVDVLWSYSIWLEVAAILPQLYVSNRLKTQREVMPQYIGLTAGARLVHITGYLYRFATEQTLVKIAVFGTVAHLAVTLNLMLVVLGKTSRVVDKEE